MAAFRETQQALASLPANNQYGYGSHVYEQVRSGMSGIYLGDIPYDPARHSPADIDHYSPMGIALGESRVRQVLPGKPLGINVVIDYTNIQEHPAITEAKQSVATQIEGAVNDALPSVTDRAHTYSIGEPLVARRYTDIEPLVAQSADNETIKRSIIDLTYSGLTLVLSDFNRLPTNFEQVNSLIAVKVNFPAERVIPAGVGFISLGGYGEVNTGDSKQLDYVNEHLQAEHLRITDELERSGAKVAAIILEPAKPLGYNRNTADSAIAKALKSLKA